MTIQNQFTANYVNAAEVDRAVEARNAASKNSGGGWLLAIALTLGKIADAMGERMLVLADKIDALQQKQSEAQAKGEAIEKEPEGQGLTALNAQLQVLGQQLGQMLQMLATIVKTIGEGNKDIARKQ